MNKIISFFLFAGATVTSKSFNSCLNKDPVQQIHAIRVSYNLPLGNWDGVSQDKNTYFDVFYYDDSILMYRFFYNYDSAVNGKLLKSEKRNDLFIFHKDSLFGYAYHPFSSGIIPREKLRVDSIKKKYSLESTRFDTLLNLKPDSSYVDMEKNLINIYKPPMQAADYTSYTLYFCYSESLKNIEETLSGKLDNIENMKLFKIRIVPQNAFRQGFPNKEIVYEIKTIPVENRQEIAGYFEKYKKEHLNK
jgi:hypothetical protein